ncbi:MAG: hypothetical protein N4Q91_05680, partial [Lactobacillus crispatus]|nr:hypothetical protein [Lactobacillus crispatus]
SLANGMPYAGVEYLIKDHSASPKVIPPSRAFLLKAFNLFYLFSNSKHKAGRMQITTRLFLENYP